MDIHTSWLEKTPAVEVFGQNAHTCINTILTNKKTGYEGYEAKHRISSIWYLPN